MGKQTSKARFAHSPRCTIHGGKILVLLCRCQDPLRFGLLEIMQGVMITISSYFYEYDYDCDDATLVEVERQGGCALFGLGIMETEFFKSPYPSKHSDLLVSQLPLQLQKFKAFSKIVGQT